MTQRKLTIVADENIPALEEYFGDLGTLVRLPGRTLRRDQLMAADILLVRSVTPVNEQLLAGTPVRFVGSCTIGIDHLDTAWLENNDIAWSAAPGCNANSVVEYVFCALAALGVDWQGAGFGIVGCGNVGGLLQKRLQALGIPCAVYDPWLPHNADAADLATVLRQDIICLHAPLVKGGAHPSFHLIGAQQLAQIKDGAVLISAGRGAVVDNAALLELLRRGKRFATVLDVWENEPEIDTALLQLVDIGTPHIAGYSLDGKLAGTRMIRAALNRALDKSAPASDDTTAGTTMDSVSGSGRNTGGDKRLQPPPAAADDFSRLAHTLLQMYDPRRDDERLRAAPSAFDRLRREYPERLEFSHYHMNPIDAAALTQAQRRQLEILGLELKDTCN